MQAAAWFVGVLSPGESRAGHLPQPGVVLAHVCGRRAIREHPWDAVTNWTTGFGRSRPTCAHVGLGEVAADRSGEEANMAWHRHPNAGSQAQMTMGQNPVPVNIPIPTKTD